MTGDIDNSSKDAAADHLVAALAQSVVDFMVEERGHARQSQIHAAKDLIYKASVSKGELSIDNVRRGLADLRLHEPEHIERSIQGAARRLGEDWLEDTRSFAEVSRASAEILSLCRDIGWRSDNLRPNENRQSIIVATIASEMHLIGPTILAQRLRRAGHSVALMCNVQAEDLVRKIASNDFDGLMISTASIDGLERVADTTKQMRQAMGTSLPICVGGAALDFLSATDLGALDVDLVTNDLNEALALLMDAKAVVTLGAAR